MKSIFLAMFFVLFVSPCLAQEKQRCPENPNSLYNRQQVLEQLAEKLNQVIPENGKIYSKFRVEDERAVSFFVYDLTDTSNKQITFNECVNFINNHVYHVSPETYAYSYSQIVILEDGKLKIFTSINCLVDKLEDVLKYLNIKLANNKNKAEIIERVKNYRKYGKYYRLHHPDETHPCLEDKLDEMNIIGAKL